MNVCISIDDKGIIVGYATVGEIENGVFIHTEEIPLDLCAGYYKFIDGKVILDEDLKIEMVSEEI